MTVKEMRTMMHLSAKAFGEKYDIPLRTIQNWENGARECPGYVLSLLERAVKEDYKKESKIMTKEKEIAILMEDHCTKAEAEKHLKNGTVVYPDFEENFDLYMNEWDADEEDIEMYRKMIENGKAAPDWGVVKYEQKTYYIQYVL